MESRKIVLQGSNKDVDKENRLVDTKGEGEGEVNWKSSIETYTLPQTKLDTWWKSAVWCGELKSGVCDNLEGWARVGGGREVQKGGDIHVPMVDSC